MAGFEDAWVRVNRAKTNFETLKREIAEFRRAHPNMHMTAAQHDGKGHVTLVARIREQIPKEWGLASGDILVDLRCALDYSVYALAVANGGLATPTFADKLEFPILVTDKWGEAIGRHKLHGLCDGAIAYIETQQPYHSPNGHEAALAILEELVGVNKHRFLYVAWAKLHSLNIEAEMAGMRIEDFVAVQVPGELKDGAVLATFRVVAQQKYAKIKIGTSLTTYEAIEPTAKGWLNLIDFGSRIGAYVEHVVADLEGFLVPGHAAPPKDAPVPLTPWGWVPPTSN